MTLNPFCPRPRVQRLSVMLEAGMLRGLVLGGGGGGGGGYSHLSPSWFFKFFSLHESLSVRSQMEFSRIPDGFCNSGFFVCKH